MEWFRFALTAFFLVVSILAFASAVMGVSRFGFIMNRIHAAGIGDTMGLACAATAAMVGGGEVSVILKLLLIVIFMWCTSPVTTHFLGQIEYHMDHTLADHIKQEDDDAHS